ncbi:MAG: pantoate--beta-alanine ligase [Phycisphaeraceae bacterium]|nr:pantoate--beta-alanine ligase [Phycisphaeraceae bacterium]
MRVLETISVDGNGKPETGGCVFVPTMGALHEGHAALIRHARRLAAANEGQSRPAVVVSVFVNPTQFNDPADLERYPRTLEADAALCERAGADVVFAPGVGTVYPGGVSREGSRVSLPAVATEPGLEDAHRPGHFAGVCAVVSRLFDLTGAARAVFGEKDWQQLQVVRAMTRMEGREVEIVASATVREADGLAMSSRNRFLSEAERRIAPVVHEVIRGAGMFEEPGAAEAFMRERLERSGFGVEYAVVRCAESLMPLGTGSQEPARALVAARLGSVRLIDNDAWRGGQTSDRSAELIGPGWA